MDQLAAQQYNTAYRNTKDDFWASLDAGKNSIVCPCCGTHMSLQFSASYHLMLTQNASVHLNQQLAFYCRTVRAVERILKRHNSSAYINQVRTSPYPLEDRLISPKGEFKNARGTGTRELLYKLDIETLDVIIQKWPRLSELEKVNASEGAKKFSAHDLLQLIQLPTLAAGINTIALDQLNTEATLARYKPSEIITSLKTSTFTNPPEKASPVTLSLINQFPYLLGYVRHLAQQQGVAEEDEFLTRAIAILTIYFGHETSKTTDDQAPEQAILKQFTFGTYAQIRNWHSLAELMTSYFYVSALQDVFPQYATYIQDLSASDTTEAAEDRNSLKLGSFDNVAKFMQWRSSIPQFEDVVLYTVDFACSGPKTTIPEDAVVVVRRNNERREFTIAEEIAGMVEARVCGWIPKKHRTESLLLVGGTASSKTTLLQSTIVQVKRAAAELGMVFVTISPLSNLLLKYYEQRFDSNQWRGATETGERTSLQISLSQANDPEKVFHLVINDIAGEHFEEMLMVEKDYNVIQSPLSHARHIIFLFDLIAWRQLGALLQDTNEQGGWSKIIEERERQTKIGRAVEDSRDLMVKLISRVVSASGASKMPINRSFILVIPKSDLYIGEGMFLNGWVTNLAQKGYLKKLGTDDDSPYMSTWKFRKLNDQESDFEAALRGINEMSTMASKAIEDLSKKISENENAVAADRVAVNIASILTYLKRNFSDVKVVPVSALGKAPVGDGNASEGFAAKAVPLFCEALLLLPMIEMGATIEASRVAQSL